MSGAMKRHRHRHTYIHILTPRDMHNSSLDMVYYLRLRCQLYIVNRDRLHLLGASAHARAKWNVCGHKWTWEEYAV